MRAFLWLLVLNGRPPAGLGNEMAMPASSVAGSCSTRRSWLASEWFDLASACKALGPLASTKADFREAQPFGGQMPALAALSANPSGVSSPRERSDQECKAANRQKKARIKRPFS
jgi:hypothetical protein